MRRKVNAFTLVELLVTIVLLGVVGVIVVYNMTSVSNTTKDSDYDKFIAKIKSAASVYADQNPEAFGQLYVSKSYIYIRLSDLIEDGLLEDTLKNPYTDKVIDQKDIVKVNIDTTTGGIVFEYPVVDQKQESFLVAMSDYVINGEPYNCMQGIGTYELSISKENGDLIMLNNDSIERYNFSCEFPKEFNNGIGNIKSTTVAGTYDITYNWITESGTKKSAVRQLRVLAPIQPTFKLNKDYNFKDSKVGFYEVTYDDNTGTWDYLTLEPLIEGADPSSTTFEIFKKSNDPVGKEVSITNGLVSSYPPFPADDGDKTYRIEAKVCGHYNKEYCYKSKKDIGVARIKSELIIPESFVSQTNADVWETNKTFSIKDGIYSPVGVTKYEYKLTNDTNVGKNVDTVSSNLFTKNVTLNAPTVKDVSIINSHGACPDAAKEYRTIYFRAINNDGYKGKWTKIDTRITNKVASLTNTGAFQNKTLYLNYNGTRFIGLEKYANGQILATLDSTNGTGKLIVPTTIAHGYAEQQTCDMLVYKYYDYQTPVVNNFYNELNNWLKRNNIPTKKLVLTNWNYGGFSKSMYVGTVTKSGGTVPYNKYGSILYENSQDFWTISIDYSPFTVYLDLPHKHGNESTTAYNAYFYYVNSGGIAKQKYVGQASYVKPIVKFSDINVCSGSGTSEDPYVIGL